jgi:hypothetical protein
LSASGHAFPVIAGANAKATKQSVVLTKLMCPVGQFFAQLRRSVALREKRKFLSQINLICPVQSPFAKIFRFPPDPNHIYIVSRSVPQRGVGHRH